MKNAFMSVFIELLYDYKTYLTMIDNIPIFNALPLIESRPSCDRNCYKELIESQEFQMFLQTSLKNEHQTSYFDERIKKYKEFLEKHSSKDKKMKQDTEHDFIQMLKKSLSKSTTYIIPPYYVEAATETDRDKKPTNKNKYINKETLTSKGVSAENQRVVENILSFNNINNDEPLYYKYYTIPCIPVEIKETFKKRKEMKTLRIEVKKKNEKITNEIKNRLLLRGINVSDLTETEREQIKENIQEILTRVFTSEGLTEEDKHEISRAIETSFGRDFFINLIYQKNATERNVKVLSKESCNFLLQVIFQALIMILNTDESDKQLEDVIYLIKASMYYAVKDKKKKQPVLMSTQLYLKLKDYRSLHKKDFWEKWLTLELNANKEYQSAQTQKNAANMELITKNKIIELTTLMTEIKIKKDILFEIIKQLIEDKIKDEMLCEQLKKELHKIQ